LTKKNEKVFIMKIFSANHTNTLEKRTIAAMIKLHCRGNHSQNSELCDSCAALLNYSQDQIDHCPWKKNKPTCSQCPTHCYQQEMRLQIRTVMRYAGPHMIWRHPFLTIIHLFRSFNPTIRHLQKIKD